MLWDGHKDDKDVRTSKVDRVYTDYSEEYIFSEAEKVNYEFWKYRYKRLFLREITPQKLPNLLPIPQKHKI